MNRYMITYLGGDPPSSPEEGARHMSRYRSWLAELGDAAVSPANPLKGTRTVQTPFVLGRLAHLLRTSPPVMPEQNPSFVLEVEKGCRKAFVSGWDTGAEGMPHLMCCPAHVTIAPPSPVEVICGTPCPAFSLVTGTPSGVQRGFPYASILRT